MAKTQEELNIEYNKSRAYMGKDNDSQMIGGTNLKNPNYESTEEKKKKKSWWW